MASGSAPGFKLSHIYAPAPATTRGQPTVLTADAKGTKFVYTVANNVVIRNLDNPLIAQTYSGHVRAPTVARFSPSGGYIASGDAGGLVRVWSPDHEEQMLKIEVPCISGPITDIAWSPDNQRIVAVGEGTDKYGHAFLMDTGASVGVIAGHSKRINTCDFKPTRPFRVVTGGEDNTVIMHEGPPFKFAGSSKDHTRFVNSVRFAPNGERYISVGSDFKGIFYDGKSGEKVAELGAEGAHTGSIFAVSWSPDGSKLITSSGDKTVKLWDAANGSVISTFTFSDKPGVEHMQVGCLWAGNHLISLGLSGDIYYLDINNPTKPLRVLNGHQSGVHALAFDKSSNHLYSGNTSGQIRCDAIGKGCDAPFKGAGHTNQVTGLTVLKNNLYSSARDDSVRFTSLETHEYAADKAALSTPPVGIAGSEANPEVAITVRTGALNVIRSGKSVSELAVKYNPTAVAVSQDGVEVAVGGDDNLVHLYTLNGNVLEPKGELSKHRQAVTALAYSPNGALLASGDALREIYVWDRATGAVKIESWVFHSSRVTSLAWSPESTRLVSGSIDAAIYVWSVATPSKRVYIKAAHPNGVNAVTWLSETTIASAGQDTIIRTWDVPL